MNPEKKPNSKQLIPDNSIILSPMAGYSDLPYRLICKRQGSAASITEFVSSEAVVRGIPRSQQMLKYNEEERPIIFQIFGHNVDSIVETAIQLEKLNPDGIDINMGCSVKKISQKGAGAALLKDPKKVRDIFRGLRNNISIPYSGKIRLGWDQQSKNYLEIGKIVEEEGGWGIFIHGRTKTMGYQDASSWDEIGELKNALQIPVFGNGDVKTKEEAFTKMRTYGVNGVLIGRAAIGNPWVFSGTPIESLTLIDRLPLIKEHMHSMVEFYGEQLGVLLFRKHLVKYLKSLPDILTVKSECLQQNTLSDVIKVLEKG